MPKSRSGSTSGSVGGDREVGGSGDKGQDRTDPSREKLLNDKCIGYGLTCAAQCVGSGHCKSVFMLVMLWKSLTKVLSCPAAFPTP